MRNYILVLFGILIFAGCENSYQASYSSNNYIKHKEHMQVSIDKIAIGSVSSSDFWKIWQREYFKDALEDALYKQGKIRVVQRGSPYRINVDIYDYSSKAKEKMGKFLGQKQYRVVQDYNIRAWWRIVRRGANGTLKQGTVTYTPYSDIASGSSFEDAKKRVIKKKLKGIANKIAKEVVNYFKK